MNIDENLAELLGILAGDGSVSESPHTGNYRITVTGHSYNDYKYLTEHVSDLIENIFGRRPSIWKFKRKNAISINLNSKYAVEFLKDLGVKTGHKSKTIEVPKVVLEGNSRIQSAFLRGISDTDFSMAFHKGPSRRLHNYPVIAGSTSSENFAYQIRKMLQRFKIKANINKRSPRGFSKITQYGIYIYGNDNFEKWMKNIGFRNSNHLTKIQVWKKLGFYIPNTSIKERLLLISKRTQLVPRYRNVSLVPRSSRTG